MSFLPEMRIEIEKIDRSTFGKRYIKKVKTHARLLTENDVVEMNGIMHTREGDQPFTAGDYLARGPLSEYPIPKRVMLTTKRRVSEPDQNGWADWQTTASIRARRYWWPFVVQRPGISDVLHGKIGDVLGIGEVDGDVRIIQGFRFRRGFSRVR